MARSPESRPLPEVVSRTRSPIQRALHALFAIVGWVGFGWFWWKIFAAPLDRTAWLTFAMLFVALLGIVAIHLLWVRFNVGIYQTRGQRTRVREVSFQATEDRLGMKLEGAAWEQLRRAQSILIDVADDGQTKRYREVDPGRGDA